MNLVIEINQDTAFHYWLQRIASWDVPAPGSDINDFYTEGIKFSKKQLAALEEIKTVLQASPRPYLTLSDLYLNNYLLEESRKIISLAKLLRESFDDVVWRKTKPHLESAAKVLQATDFSRFDRHIKSIINFLDSDFDMNDELRISLLPNKPGNGMAGHMIKGSRQIQLRPTENLNNMVRVIAHEYIHEIENESRITRSLIKRAFKKYIEPNDLEHPPEYFWKMMFIESIVYCFADQTTGGYLYPETHGGPRPTVEGMQEGFHRIVRENRYNTNHVLSWAGLNILSDVEKYIENDWVIDQRIVNKIGRILRDFYLTHGNR